MFSKVTGKLHIVILPNKVQTLVFREVYNDIWYEFPSLKLRGGGGGADEFWILIIPEGGLYNILGGGGYISHGGPGTFFLHISFYIRI